MNRSGLISDFLRGIYSGKIVQIYERSVTKLKTKKGDKEYATYQVYLPKKWINKMDTPPTRLVMLETVTGDLIILHPETIEEAEWAIEGIIKKNNTRIDINAKLRESSQAKSLFEILEEKFSRGIETVFVIHVPPELNDVFLQIFGKNHLRKDEWEEFRNSIVTVPWEKIAFKIPQKTAKAATNGNTLTKTAKGGKIILPWFATFALPFPLIASFLESSVETST